MAGEALAMLRVVRSALNEQREPFIGGLYVFFAGRAALVFQFDGLAESFVGQRGAGGGFRGEIGEINRVVLVDWSWRLVL